VRVDGQPLGAAALEALRRRTVWVDPSVYIWNRSLEANLTFGLAAPAGLAAAPVGAAAAPAGLAAGPAGAAAGPAGLAAALRDADLEEVVERLPAGMETPLGEAGGLLSGGEGQRVRFGRGLLRAEPALVLLDEPFRGLDRERRRELLARARRRWPAATLLCVTHDIAEVETFPRVLVVADGKIVEDGAPAALGSDAGSRFAALSAAERRVRASSWSGGIWRRLRLVGGRIVEEPR
jgi:ATP-binding cassette subfamily B protein